MFICLCTEDPPEETPELQVWEASYRSQKRSDSSNYLLRHVFLQGEVWTAHAVCELEEFIQNRKRPVLFFFFTGNTVIKCPVSQRTPTPNSELAK